MKSIKYLKGSVWRKWDLHVHPPKTKLNDAYEGPSDAKIMDEFCEIIEQSDVDVFGITDYFSADNYFEFVKRFKEMHPDSQQAFFLNIELRLNESVNKETEEVNVHLIFNECCSRELIEKFLTKLEVVKTGKYETPIACSELEKQADYEAASVTRESITSALGATFGKKAAPQDQVLILAAANNDGIRPQRGKLRKEVISDEIDKFCDGFFGGVQNQEYFLDIERLEDKDVLIGKKPVISGSDAHSFDDLRTYLGRRVVENSSQEKEITLNDVTWVKADPNFEGLKQLLYEPIPGERVWIGPNEPDQKSELKVIRKIMFGDTDDFQDEIVFNGNLCSIVGSRSSGKSALLVMPVNFCKMA